MTWIKVKNSSLTESFICLHYLESFGLGSNFLWELSDKWWWTRSSDLLLLLKRQIRGISTSFYNFILIMNSSSRHWRWNYHRNRLSLRAQIWKRWILTMLKTQFIHLKYGTRFCLLLEELIMILLGCIVTYVCVQYLGRWWITWFQFYAILLVEVTLTWR